MSSDYVNNNGTIPKGLKIDVMRHCMENKELLNGDNHIKTYIGTGTSNENYTMTSAINIDDGYLQIDSNGDVITSNLIQENFEPRTYDFTVSNAYTALESKQFSTLAGVKGVLGTTQSFNAYNLHSILENKRILWAGLLRFPYSPMTRCTYIYTALSYSSPETFFVFDYENLPIKIIKSSENFSKIMSEGYQIYRFSYVEGGLYFIDSDTHITEDFEFLDVYSEYGFLREIYYKFFSKGKDITTLKIYYAFPGTLNCNYIPLGFASFTSAGGLLSPSRSSYFESSIFAEEDMTSQNYFKNNQVRYVLQLKSESVLGSVTVKFNRLYKTAGDNYSEKNLLSSSSTNSHYIVLYKIIDPGV